jgi:hypothetical protein
MEQLGALAVHERKKSVMLRVLNSVTNPSARARLRRTGSEGAW